VGLFVAGAVVIGDRPVFEAPGALVAVFNLKHQTQIQVGCALFAASAPFFVWFVAGVAAPARERVVGWVAFGCGLVFVALLMVDVTALAVAALRPRLPDLAASLRDIEFLAMGAAAPAVAGMLAACSAILEGWVGRLALVAAAAYLLRLGTLFTVKGPFAADGLLGLWVPVIAFAGWIVVASLVGAGSTAASAAED
jgi:hypothetical protein